MDIRINDQALDFTTEGEETLGQIVKDLEGWLADSDLVLCSVKHENRELLSQPPEQWTAIPHNRVGTLAVTAKPTREFTVLNLQTILQYLTLLGKGLRGEDGQLLRQLASGFAAMAESVRKHFPQPEEALGALVALAGESGPEGLLALAEADRDRAGRLIGALADRISRRLLELQDPRAAVQALSEALEHCIEEIGEISVQLQTGKDRQAMDTMVRFSELSQSLIRLLGSLLPAEGGSPPQVAGLTLPEFYRELNAILGELVEAFGANDSVLIGDLMEYEIAPRLEQLRSFLQEVA